MIEVMSTVLGAVNVLVIYLVARRKRIAWPIGLAAQVPWTWYELVTRQYGFLLITAASVVVYVQGWRHHKAAS